MTKRIKTTKQEIATYWASHIDALGLTITSQQAGTHCWRCGVKKRLDRCHILADSLGGMDTPSNFVLLCKHCHIDNPNVNDEQIIWDWLKAYAVSSDKVYWFEQGLREYTYIYAETIEAEVLNSDDFQNAFLKQMEQVTHHFGQPRNNAATIAGVLRLTMNELKKDRL